MLVPLELHRLSARRGYLSPELVVGWRLGSFVAEFFAGLQAVRIAAARDDDAAFAVSSLARSHGCAEQVAIPMARRPWDFLFYHSRTSMVIRFVLIRRQVELPRQLQALASRLASRDPEVVAEYRAGLERLNRSLLRQPADSFTVIHRFRCRSLAGSAGGRAGQLRCQACGGSVLADHAWENEGAIRCLACSGLEPGWFGGQPA